MWDESDDQSGGDDTTRPCWPLPARGHACWLHLEEVIEEVIRSELRLLSAFELIALVELLHAFRQLPVVCPHIWIEVSIENKSEASCYHIHLSSEDFRLGADGDCSEYLEIGGTTAIGDGEAIIDWAAGAIGLLKAGGTVSVDFEDPHLDWCRARPKA